MIEHLAVRDSAHLDLIDESMSRSLAPPIAIMEVGSCIPVMLKIVFDEHAIADLD